MQNGCEIKYKEVTMKNKALIAAILTIVAIYLLIAFAVLVYSGCKIGNTQ